MLKILVGITIILGVIALYTIYKELQDAIEVPSEEPFLYGDYEGQDL